MATAIIEPTVPAAPVSRSAEERHIKSLWTTLQGAEKQLERRGLEFGQAMYAYRGKHSAQGRRQAFKELHPELATASNKEVDNAIHKTGFLLPIDAPARQAWAALSPEEQAQWGIKKSDGTWDIKPYTHYRLVNWEKRHDHGRTDPEPVPTPVSEPEPVDVPGAEPTEPSEPTQCETKEQQASRELQWLVRRIQSITDTLDDLLTNNNKKQRQRWLKSEEFPNVISANTKLITVAEQVWQTKRSQQCRAASGHLTLSTCPFGNPADVDEFGRKMFSVRESLFHDSRRICNPLPYLHQYRLVAELQG